MLTAVGVMLACISPLWTDQTAEHARWLIPYSVGLILLSLGVTLVLAATVQVEISGKGPVKILGMEIPFASKGEVLLFFCLCLGSAAVSQLIGVHRIAEGAALIEEKNKRIQDLGIEIRGLETAVKNANENAGKKYQEGQDAAYGRFKEDLNSIETFVMGLNPEVTLRIRCAQQDLLFPVAWRGKNGSVDLASRIASGSDTDISPDQKIKLHDSDRTMSLYAVSGNARRKVFDADLRVQKRTVVMTLTPGEHSLIDFCKLVEDPMRGSTSTDISNRTISPDDADDPHRTVTSDELAEAQKTNGQAVE